MRKRRLNIALDVRSLSEPMRGSGRTIKNFLLEISKRCSLHKYFLFGFDKNDLPINDEKFRFVKINTEFLKRKQSIWLEMVLPFELARMRADVYFSAFNFAVPVAKIGRTKFICMIHDLIPFHFQEQYLKTFVERKKHLLRMRKASRCADFIVTDSNYSKYDIRKSMSIPADRIKVIYQGIDTVFFNPQNRGKGSELLEKLGIHGKYILGIDSEEPRRNFALLKKIIQEGKNFLTKMGIKNLVVIGSGKKKIELNEFKILFTGDLPDRLVPIIYANSELFVFTSFAEGFGRPPLEAAACGVPVVAGNVTSIPEVMGDAALLCDLDQIEDWLVAMKNLLKNKSLREKMIRKGYERAETFKWKTFADELLEIFETISG